MNPYPGATLTKDRNRTPFKALTDFWWKAEHATMGRFLIAEAQVYMGTNG